MEKQSIVDCARRMFYEQGIANVSMKQLAEKCEIAPSLVTYYFKTKSNIITDVISEYSREIDSMIEAKYYEKKIPFDVRTADIVDLLVKLKLYKEDEKARTFYLEYLNCGMETLFSADFESIYRRLDRYFIMDIDRSYDQLAAVSAAAHGVVLTMIFAYYSGRLDCTYEQFVDFVLHARYKMFNMAEPEIDTMLAEGKQRYQEFTFTVKPYFVVE